MKQRLICSVGMILGLLGCRQSPKQPIPTFLPGIYVSVSENEFCRIEDSLTIRKAKLDSNAYSIYRSSGFVRRHGAKRNPVEHQSEEWAASYDPKFQLLQCDGKGQNIRYLEEQNQLIMDHWVYEKVE
jgi:hypothetical protein